MFGTNFHHFNILTIINCGNEHSGDIDMKEVNLLCRVLCESPAPYDILTMNNIFSLFLSQMSFHQSQYNTMSGDTLHTPIKIVNSIKRKLVRFSSGAQSKIIPK